MQIDIEEARAEMKASVTGDGAQRIGAMLDKAGLGFLAEYFKVGWGAGLGGSEGGRGVPGNSALSVCSLCPSALCAIVRNTAT